MENRLGINFKRDLQEVIEDLPNFIKIGVVQYNCVADEERSGIDVEEQGAYLTYERSVVLPLSEVQTIPDKQDVVTVDDIKYYVFDVNRQYESDTLMLMLRREDGDT